MSTGSTKIVYKNCPEVCFDIYPPPGLTIKTPSLSALVYFHGGGLTVGNRLAWFPNWLIKHVHAGGHAFISADYRLLPSGSTSGHDIKQDILDLFTFLHETELDLPCSSGISKFKVDANRIAVCGSSAGGLCACLAVMHVSPKPRALLSLYGQGGDFLIPHYLTPKTEIFFRGRELLDPLDFPDFIYPFTSSPTSSSVISDSPLSYHPSTSPTPGYPANPRMLVARLWLQLGVFLDYYTGQHEPSLSEQLRKVLKESDPEAVVKTLRQVVPPEHHCLFPQLNVSPAWPPTFLCHGSADSAVPVCESQTLQSLLKGQDVSCELLVLEGKDHSFDYVPEAETIFEKEFVRMAAFIDKNLV
ncbi:Alpha/Beta hydrolase protein [Mycena floridula]|nr:Alpha/Beta hydrolase protein [Mycena floridula]